MKAAVAESLKVTFTEKLQGEAVPPIVITAVCATTDLVGGRCPLPPLYDIPTPKPTAAASSDGDDADAKTSRLLMEGDITLHYDYVLEGLDGGKVGKMEAAVSALQSDPGVGATFVATLVTHTTFAANGLTPVQISTLKSANTAVVEVPQSLAEKPDNVRSSSSGTQYEKLPESTKRKCSNLVEIFLKETTHDAAAYEVDLPSTCADDCVGAIGCKGFEVRTGEYSVSHCTLLAGKCKLGDNEPSIRGQYFERVKQEGMGPMAWAFIGFGVVGVSSLAYMARKKKPSSGGKRGIKKAREEERQPLTKDVEDDWRGTQLDPEVNPFMRR
jgi:hypothetical protein